VDHFFEEGFKLANESGEDPYRERVRTALSAAPAAQAASADAEPQLF
jgi:hypothetical protein